jgi:hypothetical protein
MLIIVIWNTLYCIFLKKKIKLFRMSNDSLPPKYTTFHHLAYVTK